MRSGIFYCSACGTRLSGPDLDAGRAVRTGHVIRCAPCAGKPMPKPDSKKSFPAVP